MCRMQRRNTIEPPFQGQMSEHFCKKSRYKDPTPPRYLLRTEAIMALGKENNAVTYGLLQF